MDIGYPEVDLDLHGTDQRDATRPWRATPLLGGADRRIG
jgi:hypothetical protein